MDDDPTDLKLPGMGGPALARRLQADPTTRHIPSVTITAAGETYRRDTALAAGCDAYITKPVATRTLNAQVTRAAVHHPSPPENESLP